MIFCDEADLNVRFSNRLNGYEILVSVFTGDSKDGISLKEFFAGKEYSLHAIFFKLKGNMLFFHAFVLLEVFAMQKVFLFFYN